ncbi:MAG: ABC transporter ATP-binding protein, partial [Gammaproteobacteria bacterium]
ARCLCKRVSSPAGELTILHDISFRIARSEGVAIVGASGSGKSTLLSLLAGLDTPSVGQVIFDGTDLSVLDEDGRAFVRRGRIGFVFQSFHLLPGLSALENVILPLELSAHPGARKLAAAELSAVGLGERLDHYPNQLSGGEQQRVAIARAFAIRPQVLFADEPTGNLDAETGDLIAELLFRLKDDHQTTLVLVTHDSALTKHCDRTLKLERGRLADSA